MTRLHAIWMIALIAGGIGCIPAEHRRIEPPSVERRITGPPYTRQPRIAGELPRRILLPPGTSESEKGAKREAEIARRLGQKPAVEFPAELAVVLARNGRLVTSDDPRAESLRRTLAKETKLFRRVRVVPAILFASREEVDVDDLRAAAARLGTPLLALMTVDLEPLRGRSEVLLIDVRAGRVLHSASGSWTRPATKPPDEKVEGALLEEACRRLIQKIHRSSGPGDS